MTGKEVFLLIRRIEAKFNTKYGNQDLGRVWADLVAIPLDTANFAVGELMLIWTHPPVIDDVVREIRKRYDRENFQAVEMARPEGEAMFSLLDAFLTRRITEREYISGLYAASELFKNPEYAEQAEAREASLNGQNG